MPNPFLSSDQLPAVAAFAQVARLASFSKAAAVLGVSPSALSQTVRGLEGRLSVRLLNRTTRTVGLTEAGALFLARVTPVLEQFQAAFTELDDFRSTPAGTLRISMPRMAMTSIIAPLLRRFCDAHPQIRLDLVADDRFVNLIEEGFDAGIRFGESLAQDMIAVRASSDQRVAVVGSPDYFARHPLPQRPADLHAHRCLRFRFSSGAIYRWEFGRDGQEFDIDVDGPLICNDNFMLRDAARGGAGLAHLMEDLVRKDLERGTLIRVLEEWCAPFPGFFLYYPGRRQMPLKLRVLVDFIGRGMAQEKA
jgi:DNA-binding transcriptional LysR family regulator